MNDEEYLAQLSTIEIYAQILLGILRYTIVQNATNEEEYDRKLTKKMKFQHPSDLKLLRSCIDLLEDTQSAINEVFNHGLSTQNESLGEKYLRLYGVFNAYYLQMGAILDLARLFNLRNQDEIKRIIKSDKLIELRNKLASHTTNYDDQITNQKDFFRITQTSIKKWGSEISVVGKSGSEKINLIKLMNELSAKFETILDDIVRKELSTRQFKQGHRIWLESRLHHITNRKATQT